MKGQREKEVTCKAVRITIPCLLLILTLRSEAFARDLKINFTSINQNTSQNMQEGLEYQPHVNVPMEFRAQDETRNKNSEGASQQKVVPTATREFQIKESEMECFFHHLNELVRNDFESQGSSVSPSDEDPTFGNNKNSVDVTKETNESPVSKPELRGKLARLSSTQASVLKGTILEFSETSITFLGCKKTVESAPAADWSYNGELNHVVQLSSEFNPKIHSLLKGSSMPGDIRYSKGLVDSIVTAYKDHHNLVLTPDDIWTAILIQFSLLVNANAEELRHHFVTHKGKKQLSFKVPSGDGTIDNMQWSAAFEDLELQLKDATNPEMSHFVTNNFSTTTDESRIVSSLVFMSTLQQYFDYNFSVILCGIPQITILGVVEDWEEIGKRVELIKKFGETPTLWSSMLTHIINQFIKAKSGHIDHLFWGDIVKIQKEYMCGGTTYLNGWLTAFAVFDREGNWQGQRSHDEWNGKWTRIDLDKVTSGIATVPITITGTDKVTINGSIFAGHMGYQFSTNRTVLTPYIGWAVATANNTIQTQDEIQSESQSEESDYYL